MLDGSLTVPAEDWKLVDGCANTYVAPFEGKSKAVTNHLDTSRWYLPTTP